MWSKTAEIFGAKTEPDLEMNKKLENLLKIWNNKERYNDFSQMILNLQNYWQEQGCAIMQPYDMPAGAGTFHPATF